MLRRGPLADLLEIISFTLSFNDDLLPAGALSVYKTEMPNKTSLFFPFVVFRRAVLTFLILLSLSAGAAELEDREAYAFAVENDSVMIGGPGSDQAYTNGFNFSYVYAQGKVPKWAAPIIDRFEILDDQARWAKINYGLSLGHQIFTPTNTQEGNLITNDRPYGAWLYLGFATSLKEKLAEHFIELDLGTVGPSAGGEPIQNGFHKIIGENTAKGWSHGLKDEPTVQLFYQKRHKKLLTKNIEIIPFYGAGFGNVFIGAHFGGMIRLGPNLPDDFGASRPSASDGNSFVSTSTYGASRFSYYFFVGGRGNYINRNIFLDGNSFQSIAGLDKHPFLFETDFGFSLHLDSVSLVWRLVTKPPEFQQKKDPTSFASFSLVYVH